VPKPVLLRIDAGAVTVPQNLIQRLQEYLDNRFPKREQYTLGVALAIISSIAGNSIKTDITVPIQTKSNIYVLLCGPSGSGKSTIIQYGMDILENAQFKNILTDDTTPESLAGYFTVHPYALMRMDEFTKVIGSYRHKNYMAGLREALVKAYDGIPLIQSRSTRTIAEAKNYSLVGLADTQPITIAEEVGETDVSSGFLPRFNWFHEPSPESVEPVNVTGSMLDERSDIIKTIHDLYKLTIHNEIHFKFTNHQLSQMYKKLFPLQAKGADNYHFQPFYERMTQFTYKFAMLHEFAEPYFMDGFKPQVEVDEWEESDQSVFYKRKPFSVEISSGSVHWAINFLQNMYEHSMPLTIKQLRLNDSDKIVDAIERYQDKWKTPIPESLLYRAVNHTLKDMHRIQNAIELALRMELIDVQHVQGGKRYMKYGTLTENKIEMFIESPNGNPPDDE
jgi:energy-coupling factor transporter ATP-binding protein EcfA2